MGLTYIALLHQSDALSRIHGLVEPHSMGTAGYAIQEICMSALQAVDEQSRMSMDLHGLGLHDDDQTPSPFSHASSSAGSPLHQHRRRRCPDPSFEMPDFPSFTPFMSSIPYTHIDEFTSVGACAVDDMIQHEVPA